MACRVLSVSWRRGVLREVTGLRVLPDAPRAVVLSAPLARPHLRVLDFAGCRALQQDDGDRLFAELMRSLRDRVTGDVTGLYAVRLAGVPLGRPCRRSLVGLTAWAFPARRLERGCVLLSRPGLAVHGEQHLERAVVLVTEHSDTSGTCGVVVNKELVMHVEDLPYHAEGLPNTKRWTLPCDRWPPPRFLRCPLFLGGVADHQQVNLLHDQADLGGVQLNDGLWLTSGPAEISLFSRQYKGDVEAVRWLLGTCHWDAGQLQHEIRADFWHVTHCDSRFVLPNVKHPPAQMWHDLYALLS